MSSAFPPSEPLNRPIRLGVLISGGGTTLVNLADCCAAGELDGEIKIVIADRADCAGVERSKTLGLRTEVIVRREYADAKKFSSAVFAMLRDADVDLVLLGGFLSLLPIPDDFEHRVMNIHPSLIPAFCGQGYYGRRVHEAVLESGVRVTGCTVHFADNEYDAGPIILQTPVPVKDNDTAETLAARVFEAECKTYPEAVRLFSEGRLRIEGRRVVFTGTLPG